jgi:hypothetical protein
MPADTMLRDASLDLSSLLKNADKMFPSQRHALFKKLSKKSIGDFISNVTKLDVAESMLEFLPPNVFKANIAEIRIQMGKLSSQDLANVVYFPNSIVSLHCHLS